MDVRFNPDFNIPEFNWNIDIEEPAPTPTEEFSMVPIFGFEMYAPPFVPEMEIMTAHEILDLMRQRKTDDYVKSARELIQIYVWFADHFDRVVDGKPETNLHPRFLPLGKALYQNDIEKIKSIFNDLHFQYPGTYVRKKNGAEQFGLAHLSFTFETCSKTVLEWLYKNQYPEKVTLNLIRNCPMSNLATFNLKKLSIYNDELRLRQIFIYLKYFAPYFGFDPDKQGIGGVYYQIKQYVQAVENEYRQGNFTANIPLPSIPARLFNDDNSTSVYGGILRQFNPHYKRNPVTETKAPPNWTYKPWNELTTLQKKYIQEWYTDMSDVNANDPAQNRMNRDHKAYWKPHYPLPQFREFLTKQWKHLLQHPELMDGLHKGDIQDCPLIFMRQARHHIWLHCYTAHMKNGIILDMTESYFANAQTVFGREIQGEVSAQDMKLLIDKIKEENIKCLVLTESVAVSAPKASNPSQSEKVTGTVKKMKKKRKLKPVEEPEMGVTRPAQARSAQEKTTSETYSLKSELILDAFKFNTGDFLLDAALEELAKAQNSLSILQLKLGDSLSGNTWPESALKVKLGRLPLQREKHIPILHYKLKPYQKEAVEYCRHWSQHGLSGLLAADAGLGKTLVCLNMFFQEIARNPFNPAPILVLCPKALIHQWQKAFWQEFDQAKSFIESKIKEIPQQIWLTKFQQEAWKSPIKGNSNQLFVQRGIENLKTDFYPNLLKLLYGLGHSCGEEGRAALSKLLDGFPHDIRLVYLASLSGELVAVAENSNNLESVLFRKPRLVITTPSALLKMDKPETKCFSSVVIDEADSVVSEKKEKRMTDLFNAWQYPQNRLLVTATPVRNSISDVWRLLELVNGTDKNGQEFFNQLLIIKEEFMRHLIDVTNDVEVDLEEMVFLLSRLHQRVRYLRENIHPLTFTARRDDPEIRRQWNGLIPDVQRKTIDIKLNEKQQRLLNTTLKVNDLFSLYDFETKVKQHPDLLQEGSNKLIEQNSFEFQKLVTQARSNPQQVIEGSPMWQKMMNELQKRVERNEKSVIVCRHIVPQLILKELIGSFFARHNILSDCIHGDMKSEQQGSILAAFKREDKRPAVLLLINKSGRAGLDFPDGKAIHILGEEWNEGSREQIESRINRVGVGGNKEIIYYHAGLQHEKHMRDTSAKKKLWGDLVLSHPPCRETFIEDIEMMLKACVVELCTPVKNGKQMSDEQRERLGAFSVALIGKTREYEKEIYEAYEQCKPKEAQARPSSPKKIKTCQVHPFMITGQDGLKCMEIPLRDTKENAWRLAFMNVKSMMDCTGILKANQEEQLYPNTAMMERLKRHEKEKFDENRYRVVMYAPDGSSQVLLETPQKSPTIRLLALPDGSYSPLVKL